MTAPRPVPAPPSRPTVPADGDPERLVRWTFDVLNAHDTIAVRQAWTDRTLERMPHGTYRGADEIAGWFDTLFTAVPDTTLTVLALAAQGETVFVRWRLTGTHTGGVLLGLEPSGAHLDVDGVDHFTVSDGRIVSNFVVFDQTQFARQLGLLPTDGSRLDVGVKQAFNALTRWRRG